MSGRYAKADLRIILINVANCRADEWVECVWLSVAPPVLSPSSLLLQCPTPCTWRYWDLQRWKRHTPGTRTAASSSSPSVFSSSFPSPSPRESASRSTLGRPRFRAPFFSSSCLIAFTRCGGSSVIAGSNTTDTREIAHSQKTLTIGIQQLFP